MGFGCRRPEQNSANVRSQEQLTATRDQREAEQRLSTLLFHRSTTVNNFHISETGFILRSDL